MKCKVIRKIPSSDCKVGDIIESPFCWYLVDLGYAVPLDFEWKFNPIKASKARAILEQSYGKVSKTKKAKSKKGIR